MYIAMDDFYSDPTIMTNVNGITYDRLDGADICDVCNEHYHNCKVHTYPSSDEDKAFELLSGETS